MSFILNLCDEAAGEVNCDPDIKLLFTVSRFGQKSSEDIVLDKLVELHAIECVSVHAAINIVPKKVHKDLHLMWSREGLNGLVGDREQVFPALSMSECATYKSNIDGKPADINKPLLEIFSLKKDATLNFAQFYTDSAHTHMPFP